MSPEVSIILPTHNRAWCLERALNSVMDQEFRNWELIVVDDGSTDSTPELLRRYPRARTLRLPENRGVSHARNRGVREARASCIAFLDSDDAWLPQKLSVQMEFLRRHPGAVACYTDEIWIRRGVRVNPMKKHRKFSGWIFPHCLPLCIISPSSILLRRSVWEEIGPFDETLPACEDYDWWLRLTWRHPVEFLDQPLIVKYGGHEDQLSRRFWGMDRFRVRALEKLLREARLSPGQQRGVLETLVEKTRILYSGFEKRGNREEAERYAAAWKHYAAALDRLSEAPVCGERPVP